MKNTLPVFQTISTALLLCKKNFVILLKLAIPLFVVSSIFLIGSELYPQLSALHLVDGKISLSITILLYLFIGLVYLATWVIAIVGFHRVFLLGKDAANINILRWSRREMRYVGWWLLIFLEIIVISILSSVFLIPVIDGVFESEYISGVVFIAIEILTYYLVARLSLVLPATAVDDTLLSLKWSWKLSAGNSLKLALLVGLFPYLASYLFAVLPESIGLEGIPYLLLVDIVWVVVVMFEIALLSLSYASLSKNQNNFST